MLPGTCLATLLYALAVGLLALNAVVLNVLNKLFTLTPPPNPQQANKQTKALINPVSVLDPEFLFLLILSWALLIESTV